MQSHHSDLPNGFMPFSATWHPVIGNRINGGATVDKGKLTQLNEAIEKQQPSPSTSSLGLQFKQDENRISSSELNVGISSNKDVGTIFLNASSLFDNGRADLGFKSLYDTIPQPPLSYPLGNHLTTTKSSVSPSSSGPMEPEKAPSFKQGQRSRLSFSKPSKSGVTIRSQPNKGMVSDNRIARPPADGRGRNQLLPRYWPKMTDQELLQISGEYPFLYMSNILSYMHIYLFCVQFLRFICTCRVIVTAVSTVTEALTFLVCCALYRLEHTFFRNILSSTISFLLGSHKATSTQLNQNTRVGTFEQISYKRVNIGYFCANIQMS